MALIEINDLYFKYSSKSQVIKGINLKIFEKSWVSIIGHNGSGKSTLAKLIVGLLKASSGTILIDNILLEEKTVKDIRQKIGMVFQNPDNQFVGITVKHDIAFGLENQCIESNLMKDIVKKYSSKVKMQHYLEKAPSELSGGEKQRIAIAGVLAMKPKIVIFDESTAMLDPEGTKDIKALLEELKKEKEMTIISITHDLKLAALSDRVIVMDDGKILLDDTPDEVFKEVEVLQKANLDVPIGYKLKEALLKNEKLKNNPKVGKLLCQLNLRK